MGINLTFNFSINFSTDFGKFIGLKDSATNKRYQLKRSLDRSKNDLLEENEIVTQHF